MGPPNRPTKEVRKQGTCRTPTFPTKSNARTLYDAFRRQQAVADKALFPKYLGKRRGQVWNSFGKILLKVGIYPRHWYSESLNYTCFRELNVLFLWVAYVNMSQEQGFRKVKFDIASASRRFWYESESGVKAGPKQDPKTFKSSSNLDIKVKFNRRKWYLF